MFLNLFNKKSLYRHFIGKGGTWAHLFNSILFNFLLKTLIKCSVYNK